MRLIRLHLQNYRRYRGLDLEFPDGVTALVGRNGMGKSTILEAVLFALYGAPALGTNKELVRHDRSPPADAVEVRLELLLAGQAWAITRAFRGRAMTPQASLSVDGVLQVPPGAGSAEAVTQQVQRAVGLSLEAFQTTLVARQKELARLADMRPRERKQQILHMLGIDRLDAAVQEARRRRNALQERLEGMRTLVRPLGELEAAVASATEAVAPCRQAYDAAANEAAAAEEAVVQAEKACREARAAVAAWRQARHDVEKAESSHGGVVQRLASLAAAIEEAEKAEAQAQETTGAPAQVTSARQALDAARRLHQQAQDRAVMASRIEALRKRLAHLQETQDTEALPLQEARGLQEAAGGRVAGARAAAGSAATRLRRLKALGLEAPCPTCEQPLGRHLSDVLPGLEAEHERATAALREAEAVRLQADAAVERAVRADRAAHDAAAMAVRIREEEEALPPATEAPPELAPLEADLQAAEQALARHVAAKARAEGLPRRRAEQAALAEEADAQRQAVQAAREHLASLEDPLPRERAAEEALSRHRVQARAALGRAQAASRAHDAATAALSQAQQRLQDAQSAWDAVRRTEAGLHAWTALVGPRGGGLLDRFKDHMTGRIRPAIQAEAGRLLGLFTGGRYDDVHLDEEYRVYVADGGVPYTLDRFSGGEADVVHLALRLAVSRLLAERSGTQLSFLALDEVFGSLDRERQEAVVAALQGLSGIYRQVFVVTHTEGLREALDHVLEVVDTPDGTGIRMHNG